jgi:type IV fimbrial biogenesis protein FimT
MKHHAGISLIELLVTLAIGATVMSAVLPNFGTAVDRQRAVAAHNLLLATLQHARTAAVFERGTTVVCPSHDGLRCEPGGVWESGWISFIDRDGNGALDASDTLLRFEAHGVAKLQVRTSTARPQVRFRPDGRSAGSNLTIRMCDSSGGPLQGIVINNGGRARRTSDAETSALTRCS